ALVVDDLEQVAVAGCDLDGAWLTCRESADDVVRLVVLGPEGGHAERRQDVEDDRYLAGQAVGDQLATVRGQPVCLVRGQQRDPPRRAPVLVERAHQATRLPAAGYARASPPCRGTRVRR